MQVGTLQELKDWDFSNIIAEAKERLLGWQDRYGVFEATVGAVEIIYVYV